MIACIARNNHQDCSPALTPEHFVKAALVVAALCLGPCQLNVNVQNTPVIFLKAALDVAALCRGPFQLTAYIQPTYSLIQDALAP